MGLGLFFAYGHPVIPASFAEKTVLSVPNALCQKSVDCICVGAFLGCLFRLTDVCAILWPISCCVITVAL